MAALVVIALVRVCSRSAAAVTGSGTTLASTILLFSCLLRFRFDRLLPVRLWRFRRLRTRRCASFHNQSLNIVEFGIQVVQTHLDVGHALGNREYVSPGRHGHLLQ